MANKMRVLAFGVAVAAIVAHLAIFAYDAYLNGALSDAAVAADPGSDGPVLFTTDRLSQYVGKEKGDKIYIAILGEVFDVTSGRKFYGPKRDYHHFAGRDASRAFITGDSEGDGLTDDIAGLSPEELEGLKGWYDFYIKHANYTYMGQVVGRYYNEAGESLGTFPYEALAKRKELTERKKQLLPDCNSKWTAKTGSTVWCTLKSGGVEREWAGVPRLYKPALDPEMLLVLPSTTPTGGEAAAAAATTATPTDTTAGQRCACVPPERLEDEAAAAYLEPYVGCDAASSECKVQPPNK